MNTQIFSTEIPKSEAIVFEPLLPKHKIIQRITTIISLTICGILGSIAYVFVSDIAFWMYILFVVVLFILLGFFMLRIQFGFPHKGYAIRKHDVHYKTGWLTRKTTSIPICRIQHIIVNQGILSKKWGLAKLEIYTAGDSSDDIKIPGITFEKAQDIKAMLSNRIKEDE